MSPSKAILSQLDPDAAERVSALGEVPPMRERGLAAVRDALESAPLPPMPAMAAVDDCVIDGPVGEIPLRIYRPSTAEGGPVLVYFHGGGMVLGSNRSFEPLARNLAHHSGAVVVAVEYHLAPEAPPPAQFDDAYAATEWVAAHADTLHVDSHRLAVVGDSAGGTRPPGTVTRGQGRRSGRLGCPRSRWAAAVRASADVPRCRQGPGRRLRDRTR